jgi:hypothetical protein
MSKKIVDYRTDMYSIYCMYIPYVDLFWKLLVVHHIENQMLFRTFSRNLMLFFSFSIFAYQNREIKFARK